MPKFANAFALLGESESEDVKELIEVVDERADVSLLEALKKKNAIAKKEADAKKKKEAKEKERLQREIQNQDENNAAAAEVTSATVIVPAENKFSPSYTLKEYEKEGENDKSATVEQPQKPKDQLNRWIDSLQCRQGSYMAPRLDEPST
ncbi:hypothetical protein FF1_027024 [Malus domestica]